MDFDQATRAGIIAAGLTLFNNSSIHEFMVDDIVREAGVTKKIFYRFFRNKNDFIVECYSTYANDVFKIYQKVLEEQVGARARILAIFEILERVAHSSEFMGCGLMRAGASIGNRHDHPLRLVVSRFKKTIEEGFERILAEDGLTDCRLHSRELSVILDGTLAHVMYHREPAYALDGARLATRLVEAAQASQISAAG